MATRKSKKEVTGAYGCEFVTNGKGRVVGAWCPPRAPNELGSQYRRPFKPSKYGGLDECVGEYTPEQIRRKMYEGTLSFH